MALFPGRGGPCSPGWPSVPIASSPCDRYGWRRRVVDADDVYYLEAQGDESDVRLRAARRLRDVRCLGEVMKELGRIGLVRVHRNHAVNPGRIREIRPSRSGWEAQLVGAAERTTLPLLARAACKIQREEDARSLWGQRLYRAHPHPRVGSRELPATWLGRGEDPRQLPRSPGGRSRSRMGVRGRASSGDRRGDSAERGRVARRGSSVPSDGRLFPETGSLFPRLSLHSHSGIGL
jgi:hypothetical protein